METENARVSRLAPKSFMKTRFSEQCPLKQFRVDTVVALFSSLRMSDGRGSLYCDRNVIKGNNCLVSADVNLTAWRLLELEAYDAFMNMAVDEAILDARIQNAVPNTVRFYRWKPSAVSVGRFQNIEKEVRLEECRKLNVDVVRRITGGGTVYHDSQDEITYSVVARKQEIAAEEITAVYSRIYAGMAEALRTLGVEADFNQGGAKACPNLTVNGKKISGSAQAHRRGAFLQHGTLLLEVNLERMFTFLRVPWAETCMHVVSVAKNKITSVNAELGRTVSQTEVNDALVKGFEKALDVRLVIGKLTAGELEVSKRLCEKKYATDDWNFHMGADEQRQEDFARQVLR